MNLKDQQTLGYHEAYELGGTGFAYTYALKRAGDEYLSYYDRAPIDVWDTPEDGPEPEILRWPSLAAALAHLQRHGADPERFRPFKGCKPL